MDQIKPRPAIALTPIDSSQIHAIGHHPESNTLRIQFKNKDGGAGSIYDYANFTAEHHQAFMAAESKGSHFGKHIKKNEKHPFERISD